MEEGERILPSSSGFVIESCTESRERERAKGVLVAPDWPGSSRLAVVEERVRMKRLILAETVSLMLECPKKIISDTFRGVPKFDFNVYVFNF